MRRIDNGYIYFRVISIFTMIILHTMVWINSDNDFTLNRDILDDQLIVTAISHLGFIPLSLVIIAGIILERFLYFYQEQETSTLLKIISIQSLFYVCMGLLVNILGFGLQYWYQWDILYFIGFSLLLGLIIHRGTGNWGMLLFGILLFISPNMKLDFLNPYIQMILFGSHHGDSFYPIVPWFSWFIFGFFISKIKITSNKFWIISFITCLAIILFFKEYSYFPTSANNIWGPDIFQPEKIILFMNLIKFFMIYSILQLLPTFKILKIASKNIFLLYFIHVILGNHLTQYFHTWGYSWVAMQIPLFCLFIFIIYKLKSYFSEKLVLSYLQKNIDTKINKKTKLIEEAYLDSLGILNLITFLSKTFNINIELNEIDEDKLKDIESISNFIKKQDEI